MDLRCEFLVLEAVLYTFSEILFDLLSSIQTKARQTGLFSIYFDCLYMGWYIRRCRNYSTKPTCQVGWLLTPVVWIKACLWNEHAILVSKKLGNIFHPDVNFRVNFEKYDEFKLCLYQMNFKWKINAFYSEAIFTRKKVWFFSLEWTQNVSIKRKSRPFIKLRYSLWNDFIS